MLVKISTAQDIEQSVKNAKNTLNQEVLSTTGSIGASMLFYNAQGIAPRRDPYFYLVNANLNFSLFNKISVPFSAVLTKQNYQYTNGINNYSNPFNQFGLSPSYKWLTVHAGYRSLQFSEYTLSGALFLGGGIEVKPSKSLISGTAFYGRFVKASPVGGAENVAIDIPAYERWGGGAKLKLGTTSNYTELIFLKIKDNPNSIPFDTALTATPQENQILGIGTKQKLNLYFSTSFDFAYSMLTKNLYDDVYKLEKFSYINQIYSPRPSSQFNKAINASLDFTPGQYKVGFKYKRIDPDYKTLGSVFLTNDVEEISFNASASTFKNKLTLALASGLQHNNLDNIQVLTSRRIIGSINASYAVNEHLNLSANYSNFSSNATAVKDVFSDSLHFVQVTENASTLINYVIGNSTYKHSFSNNTSYMEADGNQQGLSTFLNETILYTLSLDETGWRFNTSLLYNRGTTAGLDLNEGFGPNLGIQKSLIKNKMQVSLNYGFQNTKRNGTAFNKNTTYTFTFNFKIDKHQSLKVNITYLKKQAIDFNSPQFKETRAGISYVYNFGFKSKKLKQ